MIGKSVAWFFSTSRDLIARRLVKLHVTPNMLTLTGCVCTSLTGVMLGMGIATGQKFFYAFAVLLLYWCAACDMLDGAVARIGKKASTFGAFLDSTTDRVSDFVLWAGMACGFICQKTPNITFALLCMMAIFHSMMISYTKSRAETLIGECNVGFWQRGERFAAILFAALAANPGAAVLQQGISPAFTTWRRISYTYAVMAGKTAVKHPRDGKWYQKIQPWMYPQMTWPYDIAVLGNIAFLLFFRVDPAKMDVVRWLIFRN